MRENGQAKIENGGAQTAKDSLKWRSSYLGEADFVYLEWFNFMQI